MYHSLNIGDKNTWDDYGLVPVNKIYFPSPSQKTQTVEIEGASGSLDFSTILTGYPIYQNISGDLQFYLLDRVEARTLSNSGYPYPDNYTFYDIFMKIRGDLDGKTVKVWLEDDPDWYYEGRINVTTAMSSPRPVVTIRYDFEPYKKSRKPMSYNVNGLGAIIARQIIPEEIVGCMPTNFSFTVTGGTATVRFKCDKLGIDESNLFQEGTHTLYEWVMYGESTVFVSANVGVKVKMTFIPGRL